MFRRAGGNFYARDKITGRSESLGTSDRTQAKQLLAARNQAAAQPQLNRTMAKAYLSAKSPDLLTRTWADVMEHTSAPWASGRRGGTALLVAAVLPRSCCCGLRCWYGGRPFAGGSHTPEHERAGNSAHHYLRRLHNYALHLGWLLMPVMADAAWPEVRKRKFTAITEEEHRRIVDRERNVERKLYYEMLWETGGAQTDIASLYADQIDLENETIRFRRRKLAGKESGGESLLRIGPSLKKLLLQLPTEGYLFPNVHAWNSNTRSSEFCRRCRMLGIEGRSLHSYRYAWAQRARAAGMPEREAMNHLGHESTRPFTLPTLAVPLSATALPLEFYEAQKREKVVQFTNAA